MTTHQMDVVDGENDGPYEFEDTPERRRQAFAMAIHLIRACAPQEDPEHPLTVDLLLLGRMREELERDTMKPSMARDDVATQAEEPIEDRLHRAWLNGYREGSERAHRGIRWDHS